MRLSNRLTPSNPSNGADWAAESRASWRKMVMATPADFRFVIDVVPSEGDYNAVHLSHVGTARLFEETRIGYLRRLLTTRATRYPSRRDRPVGLVGRTRPVD